MGRSKPVPDFLRSLGARLTVACRRGISKPQLLRAQRILERASSTAESGMPTMVMPGMPPESSTSTVTGTASMPTSVAA